MTTARIGGIDIYYKKAGSGPKLLFFNGSGATLAGTAALIAPFVAEFEVVAADQRGVGGTSLPDEDYSMADLASDARSLVDHLGWDHFCIVGMSFGGMIAQE